MLGRLRQILLHVLEVLAYLFRQFNVLVHDLEPLGKGKSTLFFQLQEQEALSVVIDDTTIE